MNDDIEQTPIKNQAENVAEKEELDIISDPQKIAYEEKIDKSLGLLTELLSCAKGIKGVLIAILLLIIFWYILSFAGFIY